MITLQGLSTLTKVVCYSVATVCLTGAAAAIAWAIADFVEHYYHG